jgi:hypothetical protein
MDKKIPKTTPLQWMNEEERFERIKILRPASGER